MGQGCIQPSRPDFSLCSNGSDVYATHRSNALRPYGLAERFSQKLNQQMNGALLISAFPAVQMVGTEESRH